MDKLITENFNAVTFSLIGYTIVFIGLVVIALYIKYLPVFLHFLEFGYIKEKLHKKDLPVQLSEQELEEEAILAVMIAFRIHNLSGYDDHKVTWKRHQGPKSSWDISRRADTLRRQ